MSGTAFVCAHCGITAVRPTAHVNRSREAGLNLYCGRRCSGFGRRKWKTRDQKITEKRRYDKKRRALLADELRAQKAEYHKRTYDPVKAAEVRKKRMPAHVEYCRRPEYKKYKQQYDKRYRSNKEFGPFSEAFLLLKQIENEIAERASKYEIYIASNRCNKKQHRRRDYDSTFGRRTQAGALGNSQRHQKR